MTIRRMGGVPVEIWEACARVPLESHVIQQTSSLALSSLGASHTQATDITTGRGFTGDWSGTDSFPQLWPTRSQWGNRYTHVLNIILSASPTDLLLYYVRVVSSTRSSTVLWVSGSVLALKAFLTRTSSLAASWTSTVRWATQYPLPWPEPLG